jgi:hypothetical protein
LNREKTYLIRRVRIIAFLKLCWYFGCFSFKDLDDLKEAHEEATDRDHGKFLQVFTRLHKTMKDPKLTYPFRFW